MNKYKLIHTQTKEETICEKVTIDSFDYYIENGNIVKPIDFSKWQYSKHANLVFIGEPNALKGEYYEVLATNNPNIDIPKVIDEVVKLAEEDADSYDWDFESPDGNGYVDQVEGFKNGYNKSQETHPNSDEDMIEFAEWYFRETFNTELHNDFKSTKELLDIWKSQQPITIYYGEKI